MRRNVTFLLAVLFSTSIYAAGTMDNDQVFSRMKPTVEMEREAKSNPNGWIYAIDGSYGPNDAVPPEHIAGAWKVDANGVIIPGSFQPNPKYKPKEK